MLLASRPWVLGLRAPGQCAHVRLVSRCSSAAGKLNENRAFTNNHILELDAAAKADLEKKIDANNAIVDKNLKAVEGSLATDEGKRMFAALQGHLKEYREARAEVLELSNAGKRDEAVRAQQAHASCRPRRRPRSSSPTSSTPRSSVAAAENHAIEAAAAASRTRSLIPHLRRDRRRLRAGAFGSPARTTTAVHRSEPPGRCCATTARRTYAKALDRVAHGDLTVEVTSRSRRSCTADLGRRVGDIAEAVGTDPQLHGSSVRPGLQRDARPAGRHHVRAVRAGPDGRRRFAADGRHVQRRPAAPCRRSPPR